MESLGKEKDMMNSSSPSSELWIKFCPDEEVGTFIHVKGSILRKAASKLPVSTPLSVQTTPTHRRVAGLRTGLRPSPSVVHPLVTLSEEEDNEDINDLPDGHSPLKPSIFLDNEEQTNVSDLHNFPTRNKKGQMVRKATESTRGSSRPNTPTTITTTPGKRTPSKRRATTPLTPITPKHRVGIDPTTPKTSKTPKTNKIVESDAKTPFTFRRNMKQGLRSRVAEMLDEESGSSDYSPSESEDEEESDEEDQETTSASPVTPLVMAKSSSNVHKSTVQKPAQKLKSVYAGDEYFTSHTSNKVLTSDHTLGALENPQLSQENMQDILKKVPLKHEEEVQSLIDRYKKQLFPKLQCLLHEGFNILLYGLGSKRELLNAFNTEVLGLGEEDVLVVNGFFPGLTAKEVLQTIASDVLEISHVPGDVNECLDLVTQAYCESLTDVLYLLVHNLDGQMLQNEMAQGILARLAACDRIHLIASIDHIHSPLLFDQSTLDKFQFVWQDITTFLPYSEETAYENTLMLQRSGALALSSLRSVFLSLNPNARAIYMILVEKQLAVDDSKYQGMTYRDLYQECRDSFLVSSDVALRGQLTEFHDHQLVKERRGSDGTDVLVIPVPRDTLLQFKDLQSERE